MEALWLDDFFDLHWFSFVTYDRMRVLNGLWNGRLTEFQFYRLKKWLSVWTSGASGCGHGDGFKKGDNNGEASDWPNPARHLISDCPTRNAARIRQKFRRIQNSIVCGWNPWEREATKRRGGGMLESERKISSLRLRPFADDNSANGLNKRWKCGVSWMLSKPQPK